MSSSEIPHITGTSSYDAWHHHMMPQWHDALFVGNSLACAWYVDWAPALRAWMPKQMVSSILYEVGNCDPRHIPWHICNVYIFIMWLMKLHCFPPNQQGFPKATPWSVPIYISYLYQLHWIFRLLSWCPTHKVGKPYWTFFNYVQCTMCCGVCQCISVKYVTFTNIQLNINILSWTYWFLNSIVLVSSHCREGMFLWMTISLCFFLYVLNLRLRYFCVTSFRKDVKWLLSTPIAYWKKCFTSECAFLWCWHMSVHFQVLLQLLMVKVHSTFVVKHTHFSLAVFSLCLDTHKANWPWFFYSAIILL